MAFLIVHVHRSIEVLTVCAFNAVRSFWVEIYIMVNRVNGRRSERQRKKSLTRFSNTIDEPVIIGQDDQDVQDDVEHQQDEVDRETITDTINVQTENEDRLVQEIYPSTTNTGKRKLKEAKAMHEVKTKKSRKDPIFVMTPNRLLRSASKSSASRSRIRKVLVRKSPDSQFM
ncbi:hypothetical protein L1887_01345 [Cichorium endivia]|nr:hypothetical protein L1887_01345 [Cichorium endivia]